MKAITKEETLNNRFCKFDKRTNQIIVTKPTREQALRMRTRTLCLYIASSGLKFRNVEKSTENANSWLSKPNAKKEIIELFF